MEFLMKPCLRMKAERVRERSWQNGRERERSWNSKGGQIPGESPYKSNSTRSNCTCKLLREGSLTPTSLYVKC
eukprot:3779436-Amphidinium_carterae.1